MSGGVTICTCTDCTLCRALLMTQDEQYLKAHNYFRCRHGQPLLSWDAEVACNAATWAAACPSERGVDPHNRPDGSNSYALTPPSGENVGAGHPTPEAVVENWYDEITGYKPGGGVQGVGHYTAMIWAETTKLGCALQQCHNKIHVCHYADKFPNSGGVSGFVANVPQDNAPTNTERYCCHQVYGPAPSGGATCAVASTPTPAPTCAPMQTPGQSDTPTDTAPMQTPRQSDTPSDTPSPRQSDSPVILFSDGAVSRGFLLASFSTLFGLVLVSS